MGMANEPARAKEPGSHDKPESYGSHFLSALFVLGPAFGPITSKGCLISVKYVKFLTKQQSQNSHQI